MSLSWFCKCVHLYDFSFMLHTRDVVGYIAFPICLTLLSRTVSRSLHRAAGGIFSFFLVAE